MIILALVFFQCLIPSNGHCCVSWTKNNELNDLYRKQPTIRNSTSTCTLKECMAVCTGDPDCVSVGFDEGNCLCYVYNTNSTSSAKDSIPIQGWQHFDIQQGLYFIVEWNARNHKILLKS